MLLLVVALPRFGIAEDTGFLALGFRAGISAHTERNDFTTYEVFTSYGLPWKWRVYRDWVLSTRFNASAGVLDQQGDIELFANLGPGVALSTPWERITLDGGGGISFVSDDRVGEHDFGGPFQFNAHGGITFELAWNLALGYRFYHISDGGIFNGHGLNRHLLELSYHF